MTYWRFFLKEEPNSNQGWMEIDDFCRFLKLFRFQRKFYNLEDLQQEFSFLIDNEQYNIDQHIVPYDFYRLIFLERNL